MPHCLAQAGSKLPENILIVSQTPQYVRQGHSIRRVQPQQSAAKSGLAARLLARAVTGKRAMASPLTKGRTGASLRSALAPRPVPYCLPFCRCGRLLLPASA